MLLLFNLGRPDILSFGDLAIQRGMRMVYHHRKITREMFGTLPPPLQPVRERGKHLPVGDLPHGRARLQPRLRADDRCAEEGRAQEAPREGGSFPRPRPLKGLTSAAQRQDDERERCCLDSEHAQDEQGHRDGVEHTCHDAAEQAADTDAHGEEPVGGGPVRGRGRCSRDGGAHRRLLDAQAHTPQHDADDDEGKALRVCEERDQCAHDGQA